MKPAIKDTEIILEDTKITPENVIDAVNSTNIPQHLKDKIDKLYLEIQDISEQHPVNKKQLIKKSRKMMMLLAKFGGYR